jgi:hypothetical protein
MKKRAAWISHCFRFLLTAGLTVRAIDTPQGDHAVDHPPIRAARTAADKMLAGPALSTTAPTPAATAIETGLTTAAASRCCASAEAALVRITDRVDAIATVQAVDDPASDMPLIDHAATIRPKLVQATTRMG